MCSWKNPVKTGEKHHRDMAYLPDIQKGLIDLEMKRFFPLLLLWTPFVQAQTSPADSLRHLISSAHRDSNTVYALYLYGALLEDEQPDSALYYYDKAQQLAQEILFYRGEAAYSSYVLPILNSRGKFRDALSIAKNALEIYKIHGTPEDQAIAYLNLGNEWHYLSDFNTAAENYLEARKYAEKVRDINLLRKSNNNLAAVLLSLSQFDKGRQYALEGLMYARLLKKDAAIASSLYNLATAATYLKQYDTAQVLFNEIEIIAAKTQDDSFFLDAWLGKAGAYSGQNNMPQALYHYDKVVRFSQEKQAPEYEMYAYMGLADLYLKNNMFSPAREVIDKGLVIARQLETRLEQKDLLVKYSEAEEKTGNYKMALAYFKEAAVLNDSIIGEKHQVAVANNEARYEFEKKQAEILALQAQSEIDGYVIRQHRIINVALAGGSLLLLLIILLIYRNFRHKQKLQKQRITELETEKKLAATQAIMKGEEQERSRLAKDLHDGLGGMLSGVKYTLHHVKENLVMTEDNMKAFEHSLQMLDSSITEMRRVAHNMMPESLLKFGLDTSLRDFCHQVAVSGIIKISYQSIDVENRAFEQSLAITIYRVVQELLNNIIKHASAQNVIVQLAAEGHQLTLTVEDDGKGFDTTDLKTFKGIGWKNILSRLDYHNGQLDIRSSPGKGTSVYIEFTV